MPNRSNMQSIAFAALRIVAGFMFACHGAQKLLGWFNSPGQPPAFSQLWFGGVIELVGGILIALGLFTRPVALLASGTMAVAYFQFHWQVQHAGALSERLLPIVNKGEPAVLYCFVFLMFALSGAGAYSLDARRGRG
jgi:putative oxidoreductase